ncbi:MAG: methyltransferase domain-containing protein [Candidatus Latescibacteria bacterium]|nr:methyltransferase domain-containing protein [Candidatus Latescibacterota bacterium]
MTLPQQWNARDYAQHCSAQLQWAEELLPKLGLQGDESLLDLGCGEGKITALIAARVPRGRVLGIDLSAEMIALASAQFPPADHANLSFLQMDVGHIDLDQHFDLAFSNAALHWVPDHLAVLRGVRAHLRPGGRILFQMGGRGNAAGIFAALEEVLARPAWRDHFQGFTTPYSFYGPEQYQDWLPRTGFRPQRAELVPKDMQHADAAGLRGWLRTTWFPYTDRLPEDRREAFLGEVVATYLAMYPADQAGCTHVAMVRLEVEAHAC